MVRSYLSTFRGRYRFNVNELEIFPRHTPDYRGQMDEAKARLAVVERFLSSRHLSTRELFHWRAGIIDQVADIPTTVNSADNFRGHWKLAVAELIADLGGRYGPEVDAGDTIGPKEEDSPQWVDAGEVIETSRKAPPAPRKQATNSGRSWFKLVFFNRGPKVPS